MITVPTFAGLDHLSLTVTDLERSESSLVRGIPVDLANCARGVGASEDATASRTAKARPTTVWSSMAIPAGAILETERRLQALDPGNHDVIDNRATERVIDMAFKVYGAIGAKWASLGGAGGSSVTP